MHTEPVAVVAQDSSSCMSAHLTAEQFEAQYGALVRRELSQYTAAYRLRQALGARSPPIHVSEALLKVWFTKAALPPGAVRVSTAVELQEQYGDLVSALAKRVPQ